MSEARSFAEPVAPFLRRSWGPRAVLAVSAVTVPGLWFLLPQPVVPVAMFIGLAAAFLSRQGLRSLGTGLVAVSALLMITELAAAVVPPMNGPKPRWWLHPVSSASSVAVPAWRLEQPTYPGLFAAPGASLLRWILGRKTIYRLDRDLGWLPGLNQALDVRIGDRTTVAHTDGFGARVGMPPAPGARGLLLFGCSVCFGWGVEDTEPFGRIVAERSGGRLADVNLCIPSGGPHQGYALLSAERERALVPAAGVAAAVITVLPHHVLRALGAYRNGGESPRFELVDGTLVRRGQQEVALTNLQMLPRWSFLQRQLHKSLFLARIWEGAMARYDTGLEDRLVDPGYGCELTAALVQAMTDVIARRYGAPTLVILWPGWDELRLPLKRALHARGVDALDIGAEMPELADLAIEDDPDRHPSAAGHRRIAQAVEAWLQKQSAPQ